MKFILSDPSPELNSSPRTKLMPCCRTLGQICQNPRFSWARNAAPEGMEPLLFDIDPVAPRGIKQGLITGHKVEKEWPKNWFAKILATIVDKT